MKLLRLYVRVGGFAVLALVLVASFSLFAITIFEVQRQFGSLSATQFSIVLAVLIGSAAVTALSFIGIRRLLASPDVRWSS